MEYDVQLLNLIRAKLWSSVSVKALDSEHDDSVGFKYFSKVTLTFREHQSKQCYFQPVHVEALDH